MSMNDYETARKLMVQKPDLMDFVGPRPEAFIRVAENVLQLQFPPTYRRFLLEYGAGSFGAENFFGIIDDHFETSGSPDAIWLTLLERRTCEFPLNYIVVYAVGNGEIFCLDIDTASTGEARVVVFNPGLPISVQTNEEIAEDFGALLLQLIQEELDFLAEYGEE
jgi:hypothetical protein